jgi:Flp pilus assembly protein TadD
MAIAEFESALALRPKYLAARNNLAMAYAANRQYDRALAAFKKLIELDPAKAGNYYNIAVLYALQNRVPDAIAWLKQAIDKGYQNWELIKTDKDLANIRNSPQYQQLVKGH